MPPELDTTKELEFAFDLAARIALGHASADPFLDWMRGHGVRFFIEAGVIPDLPRDAWPAVGSLLGRALWNHLPRPDNDFKPRKLPEPGRNDPCPCGSGRKYKQCCGGLGMPPVVFTDEMLLPSVLGLLAKKDLSALPFRRFSPELLADIARAWSAEGQDDRARLLLEPLFADPRHLDARHAEALDALMGIYLDMNKPRKRKALLEIGLAAADPVLRSAARQRQAAMLLDNGDRSGAWSAFQAAQRDNPDDANLALLEISMLQGEDQPDRMLERARFWLARLKRRPDAEELAHLIAFLEETASNPDAFAERFAAQGLPELPEFAALIRALPAVARPPRIEVVAEGQGRIVDGLPPRLRKGFERALEEAVLPVDWLRDHPQAWDSLDVLEALVDELGDAADAGDWLERQVYGPLFERAYSLAEAALAATPVATLPWGFVENRPWHRLLFWRAQWLAERGREAEARTACERLLAWNPEDNLGVRGYLAELQARAGRHADLLALCERYPDDFAAMRYHHALALYAVDRKGDALVVLAEAARLYPKVLKTLLAANPKSARPDRFGVKVGGDYEAWLYRESAGAAWRATGALDWARQSASALKARR